MARVTIRNVGKQEMPAKTKQISKFQKPPEKPIGYISAKGRKMHPNSIKALNAINKAKKDHAQKPLTIPKDVIHAGKVNVNDLYSGRTYIVKT